MIAQECIQQLTGLDIRGNKMLDFRYVSFNNNRSEIQQTHRYIPSGVALLGKFWECEEQLQVFHL